MKPILFLAPRLPLPADTGAKIRTLNLLRQLRQRFDVHLVCFSDCAEDPEGAETLRKEGTEVTLVPMPRAPLAYLNALVPGRPAVTIAKYASRQMRRTLADLARTREYAAVHCDHVHMAQYHAQMPGVPWVLDEHNVEHQILERFANLQNGLGRWLAAGQARRLRVFERAAVSRSTSVLAVSAGDADLLGSLGTSTPIHVIPNGVDTSYFHDQSAQQPDSADLVFVGSMDWWPNQDAVGYFAREILPLIRSHRSDVRFTIVGRAPSALVSQLAERDTAISVTGRVDDVRPYLRRAAIVVTPIRVGGGTRLKILEAMAACRPVVSTAVGAEGIDCVPHLHIRIADSPRDFASTVVELLSDLRQRERLARSARSFVVERYAWQSIGNVLHSAYRKLGDAAEELPQGE